MLKTQKTTLISDLTKNLKGAKSVILVNYTGLTVKLQQELKMRLAESSSTMMVIKNTLFKLAGKEAKLDEGVITDEVLSGQTALIISLSDAIAPLQVLAKFAKEFSNAAGEPVPQFKVGIIEGSLQNKESLIKLSKLPGRDVLLAQAVGAVAGPMYGLVGTLQGNMQKLLWILKTKSN